MKKIKRFLKWLDGFRLKYYVVGLATTFDIKRVDSSKLNSIEGCITNNSNNTQLKDAEFRLLDFNASKVYNDELKNMLNNKESDITHIKVSYSNLTSTQKQELCIIVSIFSIGLDNNIWKFRFKTSIIYDSWMESNDSKFINTLINYTNKWIEVLNIKAMCKSEVYANPDIMDFDNCHKEIFKGWIKSFCNDKEYQLYGLNNDIDIMENDATEILNDKYEDDKSMIVNIVRKKSNDDKNNKISNISDIFDSRKNNEITIGDLLNNQTFEVETFVSGKD